MASEKEEVELSAVVYVNKTWLIIPVKSAPCIYSQACGIFSDRNAVMWDPLWICDSLSISGLRFDAFSLSGALIQRRRAEKGFIFNATTRRSRAAASAPEGFLKIQTAL